MTDIPTGLRRLIMMVRQSSESDFYAHLWGSGQGDDLSALPVCTAAHFASTALRHRTYIRGKGITKIITAYPHKFLMKRTLHDLSGEAYGGGFKKPLVLFKDPQEALEKSLWCYEQNILPLIGEVGNISTAVHSALRYGIDALITDVAMLKTFLSESPAGYSMSHVKHLILVDAYFSREVLVPLLQLFSHYVCIVDIPEIGAFAELCPECPREGELVFHANKHSFVEAGEQTIVTKALPMPTPIIRYQTNLRTAPQVCTCGADGFVFR